MPACCNLARPRGHSPLPKMRLCRSRRATPVRPKKSGLRPDGGCLCPRGIWVGSRTLTPMAVSAVRWPYPVLASWLEQQNINETSKRSANITAPTLAKMQTTGVMSHTVRALVIVSLASLLYVLHNSVSLILNLLRAPILQVSNKSPVSFSSR